MADERDFRLKVDLNFPPEVVQYVERLRVMLVQLYTHAVVINEGQGNEERGFIEIQRCGHEIGEPCEKIARYEVGRGRVFP